MKIGFYAPLKPIDHPVPSGDRTIGRGLFDFLSERGHDVQVRSRLRSRWIYHRPQRWPAAAGAIFRVLLEAKRKPVDVWLTYHGYYKAPDLMGPWVRRLGVPYVVFQGIFSTKRRRSLKTLPGFYLNRFALLRADHVFTNRRLDAINLRRLLPRGRISHVPPGIDTGRFSFDPAAGRALRDKWRPGDRPVILSAAMFRRDVKTEGLIWLMETLAAAKRRLPPFFLVVAGSGPEESRLKRMGEDLLGDSVRFAGRLPAGRMSGFYSAGDLFAFPGIRESLGMVFLEAGCCGLPVVAFDNGGIPEVVREGETGFLTPPFDRAGFVGAIHRLLADPALRQHMGRAAARHVRRHHDRNRNYALVEQKLLSLVSHWPS